MPHRPGAKKKCFVIFHNPNPTPLPGEYMCVSKSNVEKLERRIKNTMEFVWKSEP